MNISLPAPVAVWDLADRTWEFWADPRHGRAAKASQWLNDHGLPASEMHRVEFYLLDIPFARIYCYERGADGFIHLTADGPAKQPPRIVTLAELPPADLL